ncbi:hypothetical protein [Microcoleus sp. Pol12B4]|uniref:hypothetical protein n=1 Tax=Microcoleus sp. Pol12B4 TaxID=3055395 RepID=UPI002FD169B0
MNCKKAIANSFQIAIAFLNMGEKGRAIFFNRRLAQINADAGRASDLLMNDERSPFCIWLRKGDRSFLPQMDGD